MRGFRETIRNGDLAKWLWLLSLESFQNLSLDGSATQGATNMFSNRQCLTYAAALAALLAASCAKQTDDEGEGGGGKKGVTAPSIFGGNGSDNPGGNNQSTDSTAVGQATPVSDSEWKQIQDSACNAWAIEPESAPAKLQLIVDVSSSMNQTANGTGNRSKWEVTRAALLEAICGVSGPG